jgi:SAM-dependent methyltransferase
MLEAAAAWCRRASRGVRLVNLRAIRARTFRCPLCGPSVLVRLDTGELAVRCVRCGATPIAMSLASVVRGHVPDLRRAAVYELSARGAFHDFLRRRCRTLVVSQYVEGARCGSNVDGVRVEDVQRLTFPDDTFDLCTSTEVFEHVPDDRRAFGEVLRVLKPGGLMLFTVPIDPNATTRERAALVEDHLVHLAPPEYHHDPASKLEPVLSFRDYGHDIVQRLRDAGFARAAIVRAPDAPWFGCERPVIAGWKDPITHPPV